MIYRVRLLMLPIKYIKCWELVFLRGYERLFGAIEEKFMAYGQEESFFIVNEPLDESRKPDACNGSHICLKAKTREQVNAFYKASMDCGAKDGGEPGIRKHYAKDYYAAFIYDPDGHKIEVLARV